MMRMRSKPVPAPVPAPPGVTSNTNGGSAAGDSGAAAQWEVRPGGMLVQKRNPDSDRSSTPPPTIRVRVKYGSTYHDMRISSQATFGELKKMMTGPTGLHHQDQKLFYKDKERDSNAFLDMTGVKDRSKILLVEDPISHEKRLLEMRKNAKMEKASKSISEISLEVDRLAGQVSAFESVITKGGKVAEKDVLTCIELLMNQLLKLDGIMGDGDVKLQRKMQVRRVQKYVETLDMLKVKNSLPSNNGTDPNRQKQSPIKARQSRYTNNGHTLLVPIEEEQPRDTSDHSLMHQQQQEPSRNSSSGAVVVTTQWETFDSTPAPMPVAAPMPVSSATSSAPNNAVHQPKFPWDFFN